MNSDLIGAAGECKYVTNIFVIIGVHVTQTNPNVTQNIFRALSAEGLFGRFLDANNSFICISAFVHVKKKLSESLLFLLIFIRGRQNNGITRQKHFTVKLCLMNHFDSLRKEKKKNLDCVTVCTCVSYRLDGNLLLLYSVREDPTSFCWL